MTDKDRARLVGRAEAQIKGLTDSELLALNVATGMWLARMAGFDENEALELAKRTTGAFTGVLLDKLEKSY